MFARCFLALAIMLLSGTTLLHAATINIDEPPELTKLRQSFNSQKKSVLQPIDTRYQQDIATVEKLSTSRPELKQAITSEYQAQKATALKGVNDKYIKDLDALEQSLIQKRNLKGALAVQEEKKRVLAGKGTPAPTSKPVAAPKKPAAAPKPVAAPKKPGPFLYKSETEGIAGAPSFTKNNVYKFNMTEVRNNTKLTIYASGKRSTNSYGSIILMTPAGQKVRVHKWSPGDFKDSVKDVKSYKKLKPIQLMVSNHIARPGNYQVSFEYKKGTDPLVIKYVELKTW